MKSRSLSNKTLPAANLHDWSSLNSDLLFIYDDAIPGGRANVFGERSSEFSAWYIRQGWAHLKSEGMEAHAVAGEWLLCFGSEIEQSFSEDVHLLSLRVQQAWPDGSALFSGGPLYQFAGKDYPKLEKLALPLLHLMQKVSWDEGKQDPRDSFLWRSRIDYLTYHDYQVKLLRWLSELARVMYAEGHEIHVPEAVDPRVTVAVQIIDALSPGELFPETEICQATGLTIGRLNRLAVIAYGLTLNAYWEDRRIKLARRAMENPSKRVKEIAADLGFVQLSHFSAWFKRNAGKSPRAYRNSLRDAG
ncbi:AraC family transcriptional regulator [Coraliomargarita parva]|uniref:AraC family transcriptional regulator n=1 Tax=Coraliomargarita parva TaxID=3014050 RepID=UPI0022B36A2B|nr:helix-turn-helix domain-containing protein [Coraliomargarita parva]